MSLTITSPSAGASVSGTVTVTGSSVQKVDGVALPAQTYSTIRNMAGLSGPQTIAVSNSSGDNASVAVTVPSTESPDGTIVTNTTSTITDASGNVWSLHDDSAHGNGNIVYENGAAAGFSQLVTKLVYSAHKLYQVNINGDAWYWDGTTPWNGPHADPSAGGGGGTIPAASLLMPPNTSATSTTPAITNGTLAGNVNISKVNVHSLLYAGHTTKVYVHYLPWMINGTVNHINVQYSSSDPAYINKAFTDMVSRGVDGMFVDWQGQSDISNTAWLASQPIIHSYPLKFAIMLDANLLANTSGANATAKALNAMAYISSQYFSDPNYLLVNGKPVVAEFAMTANGVNWATVKASYPNITLIQQDDETSPDGFSRAGSDGSFCWIEPSTSGGNLTLQDDFNTRAAASSKVAVASAYKGFSNVGTDGTNFAPWDGATNTYVAQNNAATWLASFTKINAKFSTSKQLGFVQLVTWDDYYEGTPLETGIEGGIAVSASVSAGAVTVGVTNQQNVDHLELYKPNTAGTDWTLVSTYPTSTTSITGLSSNTYYLKAIAKPFIKNALSPAIVI